MRRAILSVTLAVQAGAVMADAAAERIVDAFERTDAYYWPDQPRAEITLEGCQLDIEKTADVLVFGTRDKAWLGDLELSAPQYLLERDGGLVQATIVLSRDAERGLAAASWRLLGGRDDERPSDDEVVDRMTTWDPLGMGEWADPSMMTRFQQVFHDTAWDLALNGEGGELLERSHGAWWGPMKDGWRPVFRWPGVTLAVVLPAGEVEPFMGLLRDYVARTCP